MKSQIQKELVLKELEMVKEVVETKKKEELNILKRSSQKLM
jgi:hypothetical protein